MNNTSQLAPPPEPPPEPVVGLAPVVVDVVGLAPVVVAPELLVPELPVPPPEPELVPELELPPVSVEPAFGSCLQKPDSHSWPSLNTPQSASLSQARSQTATSPGSMLWSVQLTPAPSSPHSEAPTKQLLVQTPAMQSSPSGQVELQ
jgi:hypothetical protein